MSQSSDPQSPSRLMLAGSSFIYLKRGLSITCLGVHAMPATQTGNTLLSIGRLCLWRTEDPIEN
jgi:hypothetical protein